MSLPTDHPATHPDHFIRRHIGPDPAEQKAMEMQKKIAGFSTIVGAAGLLFGLLIPHGLLELSAVFLAGAVGMRLGWTVIAPGERPRGQVLAEQGRAVVAAAVGLVVVLLVSGLIEAMVTPSPLPTWARITIGVVVELLFLAYVFVVGRAAARRGVTGDVGEREQGYAVPLA